MFGYGSPPILWKAPPTLSPFTQWPSGGKKQNIRKYLFIVSDKKYRISIVAIIWLAAFGCGSVTIQVLFKRKTITGVRSYIHSLKQTSFCRRRNNWDTSMFILIWDSTDFVSKPHSGFRIRRGYINIYRLYFLKIRGLVQNWMFHYFPPPLLADTPFVTCDSPRGLHMGGASAKDGGTMKLSYFVV